MNVYILMLMLVLIGIWLRNGFAWRIPRQTCLFGLRTPYFLAQNKQNVYFYTV